MKNKILAVIAGAAIAAGAGSYAGTSLASQPAANLAPVQSEITVLQHELASAKAQIATDKAQIATDTDNISALRVLYQSALRSSSTYADVCSNPDVQSGNRIITVWYACSPNNPNGG